LGTQVEDKQSRETGNIEYTGRRQTIQSSLCVPSVASVLGLFVFDLCTQCCQSLWIVCLRPVYPMLPVSLDCLSSACVPNVASLSGLFVFDLCTLCCQSLWIVCLRPVYPMLPVSQWVHRSKTNNTERLATFGTQVEDKQSRETGNIGYTGRR
jgi:hypothetical protein